MNSQHKVCLIILDGWGIGKHDFTDAIYHAHTPFMKELTQTQPYTTLTTFGEAVGLPEGQMGNSEVGHLNIGGGRVVWQQLALINKAFRDNEVVNLHGFKNIVNYCLENNKPVHLMGLVSNGGVHSNMEHLMYLCQLFYEQGLKKIYIHAITDGRDTDPKSALNFIKETEIKTKDFGAKVSTIIGRYYAMDRDNRWERVKKAYDLMTLGNGSNFSDSSEAILNSYNNGITDEFIEPIRLLDGDEGLIKEHDAVLCFNFRTDRAREITKALTQEDFHEHGMHKLNLHYSTMTEYDQTFKHINVLFPTYDVVNSLGEYLSNNNKTQLRAAETEKYPHVTFFFSGGRELPYKNEHRIMEPSPKVATYDLQPEMSAIPLSEKVMDYMAKELPDFVCLNFANTDMVGHTGVWEAIVKAAETVDSCANKVVENGLKYGYQFVIIADHGNADEAKNSDGSPNTAHSTNPVPCIIISDKVQNKSLHEGKLADIAPTILKLMDLPIPTEMNGKALF